MRLHTLTLTLALLLTSPGFVGAHSGHSSRAPWDACDERVLSDGCSWTHGDDLYIGTCRGVGGDLMCVRNEPIRRASEPNPTREPLPWALLSWIPGVGVIAGISLAYLARTSDEP